MITVFRDPAAYTEATGIGENDWAVSSNALKEQLRLKPDKPGFFLAVMKGGQCLMALQHLEDEPLLIHSRGPIEALPLVQVVQTVERYSAPIGEVQGDAGLTQAFVALLSGSWEQKWDLTLYQGLAGRLRPDISGRMILACDADMFFLPEWDFSMASEAGMGGPPSAAAVAVALRQNIQNGRIFLWQDSLPCSMMMHARSIDGYALLSTVYTTPFLRGRGYASALLGSTTAYLTQCGYKGCVLYANARNPASTRLYESGGYQAIGKESRYVRISGHPGA